MMHCLRGMMIVVLLVCVFNNYLVISLLIGKAIGPASFSIRRGLICWSRETLLMQLSSPVLMLK